MDRAFRWDATSIAAADPVGARGRVFRMRAYLGRVSISSFTDLGERFPAPQGSRALGVVGVDMRDDPSFVSAPGRYKRAIDSGWRGAIVARFCSGVSPVQARKARKKLFGSSKPSRKEISAPLILEFFR